MPWNPDVYRKFQNERSAPFDDLLKLINVRERMRVVDSAIVFISTLGRPTCRSVAFESWARITHDIEGDCRTRTF